MIRNGRLTAGQARPLLAFKDRREQTRLAREAVSKSLSARELEQRATARDRPPPRPHGPRQADPDTAAAEEALTRSIQTRVEIQRQGRGGWVRMRFDSEEELMRLYDLLTKTGGKK